LATINTPERIQKLIANAGYCSRRKAEELISAGKVFINAKKAKLGDKANDVSEITVDGNHIAKQEHHIYIALYKPKGYISTTSDPEKRQTVLDLLPKELQKVKPAGRLDENSEGLMILSTDGEFINILTHPKHHHEKTYKVSLKGEVSDETLNKLISGTISLDGKILNKMPYKLNERTKDYTRIDITLTEGRKRQIREVFKLLKTYVVHLRRMKIGPIELGTLRKGQFRHLTKTEIDTIFANFHRIR